MSDDTKEILNNAELIAIDQDPLGKQGFCYRDNGDYEIWMKLLSNDEKAACLLNRSDEEKNVQVDFKILLIGHDNHRHSFSYKLDDYEMLDLWEHKKVPTTPGKVFVKMLPHFVKVYRFVKK